MAGIFSNIYIYWFRNWNKNPPVARSSRDLRYLETLFRLVRGRLPDPPTRFHSSRGTSSPPTTGRKEANYEDNHESITSKIRYALPLPVLFSLKSPLRLRFYASSNPMHFYGIRSSNLSEPRSFVLCVYPYSHFLGLGGIRHVGFAFSSLIYSRYNSWKSVRDCEDA